MQKSRNHLSMLGARARMTVEGLWGGSERNEEETPSERNKEGDGKFLSRIEGEGSEQGTALRLSLGREWGRGGGEGEEFLTEKGTS